MGSSAGVMEVYLATFAGRTDLYVANAAEVVREPLTEAVVTFARDHHFPVSAYTGTEDGLTHVGAIDFDTDDGLTRALKVAQGLRALDIDPLVVKSRRGGHLWIHTTERIGTGWMRKALKEALWEVDMEWSTDPKVEVFPKYGSGDLAVGALRLPLLPHQRTQEVYPAVTEDGESITDMETMLLGYGVSSAQRVMDLAKRGRIPSEYPRRLDGFYGYVGPKPDFGPTPNASDVLRAWGVENAKPGGTVRCPKHEDRRRSLTIFKDDQRVYCGAPACLLHGAGRGVGSVVLSRME